jgi:hypothetical protein
MVRSRLAMSRSFRFAAAAAVLALTAFLTACGGSKSTDAVSLLKQTFAPGHSVKSGKLTVGLTLDTKGLRSLPGPVLVSVTGPFQTHGKGKVPSFDLSLAIIGKSTNFQAGLLSTSDKAYLKLHGTTFQLGGPQFASLQRAFSSGKPNQPSLGDLGIKPLAWLHNPRRVGTQKVGGVDTYHVTAQVDVPRFLQDVNRAIAKAARLGSQATSAIPPSFSPSTIDAIRRSVRSASFDLWTGKDDRRLRRLTVRLGILVPKALQAKAGGLQSGQVAFGLAFTDRDKPQDIRAPANARPYSDLQALLGGTALGGSGTAPSGGSGGGGATTTPTQPSSGSGGSGSTGSPYFDCIAKAGNDVAKMQQCASLAGR